MVSKTICISWTKQQQGQINGCNMFSGTLVCNFGETGAPGRAKGTLEPEGHTNCGAGLQSTGCTHAADPTSAVMELSVLGGHNPPALGVFSR